MPHRTYVRVTASFDENGCATPLALEFHGATLQVDRVLDCRQAAATKSGGQGLRYTIRIGRHETYIFRDDAQRWFVEENDNVR